MKGRRGLTMIEVVMSLFVITVGILPVFSLLLSARQLDMQARVQAAAYSAARLELETLKSLSYTNRTAASGAFTIPSSITSEFPNYNLAGSYSITDVSGTLGDATHGVQQIVVSITWQNVASQGTQSSLRLDTLVSQGAGK